MSKKDRAPRPPKPEGAKPRNSERKPRAQSLIELIHQRPSSDEIDTILERLDQEPARVVGISCGALVEKLLEDALRFYLLILDEARFKELFRTPHAPLSSWSSKIMLAHALGLIGDEMRAQMDHLRQIRNVFAHAVRPIGFENEAISAHCMLLDIRRMTKSDWEFTDITDDPRNRLTSASLLMSLHLTEYIDLIQQGAKRGEVRKAKPFRSRFA